MTAELQTAARGHRGPRRPRLRARPRARLPLVVGAGGAEAPRARRGIRHHGVGPRGQPLPRLLEPAGEPQHRAPASGRRPRHPRAGRPARHRRAVDREPRPRRGREAHRLARARRVLEGLLHQRRRRRQRERHPDGAPAHRPRQGALDLPVVPRQHRRGDRLDGRLAPHPERVRPRPRALLRPVPLPQRVLGDVARAGERARAAPPRARHPVGRARRASPRSCWSRCRAPPAS